VSLVDFHAVQKTDDGVSADLHRHALDRRALAIAGKVQDEGSVMPGEDRQIILELAQPVTPGPDPCSSNSAGPSPASW